jgi:hypothetical protein
MYNLKRNEEILSENSLNIDWKDAIFQISAIYVG